MKLTSLKSKILICFGVWLVFAGLAAFIGLKFTDWLTYRRLSNGIGTYGKVVSKDAENHQIVRYAFVVGQQTFSDIGHGGRGNPAFNQLEIGQRVVVFYILRIRTSRAWDIRSLTSELTWPASFFLCCSCP